MKGFKKSAVFFAIGGVGYAIIELIWRRRTHWTMVIAGGICFVIFSHIAERFGSRPLVFKAALAALGVTLVELIFGVLFNIIFKLGVWDYSDMPCNLFGQICPIFSLAWWLLALAFVPLAEVINKRLARL